MKPNREQWTASEWLIEALVLFAVNWTAPAFVMSCALLVAMHEIAYRIRLVCWKGVSDGDFSRRHARRVE